MTDNMLGPSERDAGPAPEGSQDAATQEAPATTDAGQVEDKGTTEKAPKTTQEETFFDPTAVPEELKPAYKQMQAAFTKKAQSIAEQRKKVEAFDAFQKDPVGAMQRYSSALGYQLTRVEAKQALAEAEQWEPQTWGDVEKRIVSAAVQKMQEQLGPVTSELGQIKKTNLETFFDQNLPDWRQYEDEMASLLSEHPTLANQPMKLYKLAVPDEIWEARATQKALKKLDNRTSGGKLGGASTTTKKPHVGIPDKALSFQDAYMEAKKELERQGIKPGM